MNDAERDAWLREALRHAPDLDALPPRGVSESILAKARAATHGQHVRPRSAPGASANPLARFWAWLARPPVAAGFASVMAATLVGMIWWDRPMDETLARPPSAANELARTRLSDATAYKQRATPAETTPSTSATGSATPATAPPPPIDAAGALAQAPQTRWQAPSLQESASARDGKVAPPPASAKLNADVGTKEKSAQAERKAEAPAAFPPSEPERDASTRNRSIAAKKDGASVATPAADAPAPVAKSSLSTAPPAAPVAPSATGPLHALEAAPPLRGRRADDEQQRAAAANSVEGNSAKSAAAANKAALDTAKSAPPAVAAPPPAMAAAPAATPAPSQMRAPAMRNGALGESREKQASAFASSPPPPPRMEVAEARRESDHTSAPLAPLLGAIANEPAGWSRLASGGVVALDAGWRDWLMQLDTAAAGRWRQLAAGAATGEAERAGATTLRLVAPGRPQVAVRLEGSTVRVDGATAGERWQATLPAAAAERLRAAAERLAP